MTKRMGLKRVALAGLATSLLAAAQTQPAVQPGGDIPPVVHEPYPGQSRRPSPAAAFFTYERREAFIPRRDGIRLYAVPIIPDRTPYSADKATSIAPAGPQPETILSPLDAELIRAGYIVAIEDVRGK